MAAQCACPHNSRRNSFQTAQQVIQGIVGTREMANGIRRHAVCLQRMAAEKGGCWEWH